MTLPLALAGLGGRGRDWLRAVRAHPSFELAAVCDVDPARLRDVAAAEGIPADRCFASLGDALAAVPCRAAIVATAVGHHRQPCEAALDAGAALLVEKPFTTSLAEAKALVARAAAKRLPVVVAQNYRYLRVHRTVRRVVREGTLGQLRAIDAAYYAPPALAPAQLAGLEFSVLWGMAIHHLDALRWVSGSEAASVFATASSSNGPAGRTLKAVIEFESGLRAGYSATYESSGHQFFERGQEFYERLTGSAGTLHVFHRWPLLCLDGKLPRLVKRDPRPVSEEHVLLDQLAAAVERGETPDSSGEDNLRTMAIAEACIRSAREGRAFDPRELLRGE